MRTHPEHHPDIRAAVETLDRPGGTAAARVSAALRILLRRVYAADGPNTWRFSRLTGDGFPLEFVFTTGDGHLRYTVDPGGSVSSAAERLDDAVDLLAELGQPPPDPRVLACLTTMQRRAAGLNYGAWIGGRHRVGANGHSRGDQFKLYAEIPESRLESQLPFITSYVQLPSRLLEHPVQLRIVGCEPATGRLELYFRVRHLAAGALPLLMRPAGLQSRAGELAEFIEKAYGHPLTERIPGGSVGFSYRLIPGSRTIVFTLFLFARLLWGGDARIRNRFGERMLAAGQNPAAYWRFTAPLAARDINQTYHGLLGLAMASQAPIQLALGVRPPPLADRDAVNEWSAAV
jgi:hypothetical protein